MTERRSVEEILRRAYEEGRAAARRGEEADPGCTITPEGKEFLRGYVDGAAERRPIIKGSDPEAEEVPR